MNDVHKHAHHSHSVKGYNKPMSKPLLQLIVNTRGTARTVRQERDAKGRFLPGARVGAELFPIHTLNLLAMADLNTTTVVTVSHNYGYCNQTVSSVNRNTGRGNCTTFVNDGRPHGLRDNIYGEGK